MNGVYAAVVTPLKPDLSCDVKELVGHCNNLISRGLTGVAIFGTTGEGPSFSTSEREKVIREVLEQGLDKSRVIVGTGAATVPDSIYLIKAGVALGYDTFLVAPPTFYKNVSDEGIANYYRGIAQEISNTNAKIIIYHIPQFTGVPITRSVIKPLREEYPEIFIGLKESEGNPQLAKSLIEDFPGFKVLIGNERQLIEGLRNGACGTICGVGNIYPELVCSVYKMGLQPASSGLTNPPELDLFRTVLGKLSLVASLKAVLEKRNGNGVWSRVRPPLVPLAPQERTTFIDELFKANLEHS